LIVANPLALANQRKVRSKKLPVIPG
jgi:hypothetical protein